MLQEVAVKMRMMVVAWQQTSQGKEDTKQVRRRNVTCTKISVLGHLIMFGNDV